MKVAYRLSLFGTIAILLGSVAGTGAARAAPKKDANKNAPKDAPPAPAPGGEGPRAGALEVKIAVLHLEALGMEAEPVARLESLFRMELERLAGESLPTRRQIARVIQKSRRLRRCAGADKCLAEIGKRLGVDLVVTGNVAALGDSYILNIKAVDVKTRKQLDRRIASEPLRGSPDELIEAVRVAAYQLLAPKELLGSIMVLTDLIGADVLLDGKSIGKTPMLRPVRNLSLGNHVLEVKAADYLPFKEEVRVRFQKTTRVLARLAKEHAPAIVETPIIYRKRPAPKRWYQKAWVWVGVGVTAAVVGGIVGYSLAKDSVIDCDMVPMQCTMP